MFLKLTAVFTAITLFSLTGCGGGGGGGGGNEPVAAPTENEAEETVTAEENDRYIILDNYDPIDGSEGNVYNVSSVSGEQYSSYFSIDSGTIINAISWAGIAQNSSTLDGQVATFIVRVHSGDILPSDSPVAEAVVLASASLLGSSAFGSVYEFSFQDSTIFTLTPGDYWLSIIDPETENIGFLWPVERDSASTTRGNGGAFRSTEASSWRTINNGVPAREARGRNVLIEGVLQ
ncbi:hypothetical protein [Oceanicoccus sp. KOV_DT_Chl]|uniref:hypothetical protein n=1 Tax=Oceanicoccus sp. KOV_DT_Chl TaxID=1904639 RepID=UPI000C7B7D72|nr:hypothetical protein [Oceanicoccus sp. KOV_DT_Chl]